MTMHHTNLPRIVAMALLAAVLSAGAFAKDNKDKDKGKAPQPAAPKLVEVPVNSLAAAWRAELPSHGALQKMVLDEDRLFCIASDNFCYWVNRNNGTMLAITPVAKAGDRVIDVVSLSDRIGFVSTAKIAFYDRTGKFMHDVPLHHKPSSGAVGYGQLIFMGINHPTGERLSAINTKEQPYEISPEWDLSTKSEISAKPAVYQGLLFAGDRSGGVYALRTESRGVMWPGLDDGYFKTGGPIFADIFADKDGVYVASADSKLYCLDLLAGKIRWIYYTGRRLDQPSSPIATANAVYIYVPEVGLACIDKSVRAEIRKPKWALEDGRQFLASDEAFSFIRTADNRIAAVNRATGQVKFRSNRGDFAVFATNVNPKDGTVYAGLSNGIIYGIRPVLKPGTVGELVSR